MATGEIRIRTEIKTRIGTEGMKVKAGTEEIKTKDGRTITRIRDGRVVTKVTMTAAMTTKITDKGMGHPTKIGTIIMTIGTTKTKVGEPKTKVGAMSSME